MAGGPGKAPVVELRGIAAAGGDGSVVSGVDLRLVGGEITCVLGDPSGGGRALLAFLAGQTRLLSGSIAVPAARPGRWTAAAAVSAGIGVAAGDGLLPGLPIWRSFVLTREPATGFPPLRLLRRGRAKETMREQLARLGVGSIDPGCLPKELTPVERRLVGVARAFWIGTRAVLLDEPTLGLGVDETVNVLHRMLKAREAGIAVLFATSDVQHAWAVSDRFTVLYGGRPLGSFVWTQTSREELYRLMLGNQDFKELAHELGGKGWNRIQPPPPPPRQRPGSIAAQRPAVSPEPEQPPPQEEAPAPAVQPPEPRPSQQQAAQPPAEPESAQSSSIV
jgi:simple sugar transport system ATP-binding protein